MPKIEKVDFRCPKCKTHLATVKDSQLTIHLPKVALDVQNAGLPTSTVTVVCPKCGGRAGPVPGALFGA